MNLVSAAPSWLLLLFVALLVAAAIEDALRLRISNATCLAVVIAAAAAMVLEGPRWSLWQNALLFLLLLFLGTAAFAAKWLGGGDVKLFAAAGLWFDLGSGLWLVAAIFLAGGLVAIAAFAIRMGRGEGLAGSRRARIPYGIAIALGSLAVVATSTK